MTYPPEAGSVTSTAVSSPRQLEATRFKDRTVELRHHVLQGVWQRIEEEMGGEGMCVVAAAFAEHSPPQLVFVESGSMWPPLLSRTG